MSKEWPFNAEISRISDKLLGSYGEDFILARSYCSMSHLIAKNDYYS